MLVLAILGLTAPKAWAETGVTLVCGFPTLPSVVMQYTDTAPAMIVSNRPASPMKVGLGSDATNSSTVDGYEFRFSTSKNLMEVSKGGAVIISETGNCVTFGGPENTTPLVISAPADSIEAADENMKVASTQEQIDATASKGNWRITKQKSSFDDSEGVFLFLDSEENIRGQYGSPGPATITLRCMENTTSVYLDLNDMFLADIQGYGQIEYRVDEQKAGSVNMVASTDNKALGLWSGGKAIPFIKKLMSGSHVVMRATPYNESPVEFSFDIRGLETAATAMREACKW